MAFSNGPARNPLRTREDMRLALRELLAPLRPHYSEGGARVRLGEGAHGAGYPAGVAELEGFSRALWGLVPLLAGGGEDPLLPVVLRGMANGSDPGHPEYWGKAGDYDQRLVEMAAFGYALALAPEKLWTPLAAEEKRRLAEWLGQIGERSLHDCNWLFFRVLAGLGFRKVGLPYDADGMQRDLDRIEAFALGGGWYADGPGGHSDYYAPFAMHFFGLLYAKLMAEDDPARCGRFKERAAAFARDFVCWFAEDGSALPYGRSLTYRFAQSAFWGALAYADVGVYAPGVVKGIVLRNLRRWLCQPAFNADGTLAVGYAYPNLVMAENYNSPCSPYWALKAFLPLALADDHPFWLADEEPLPDLPSRSVQRAPHLVVCRRRETDHVVAFNCGHGGTNEHTHAAAKYEKFAYSTAFGFSVPRGEWGLAQGAFDSTLALSERDNLFRVRRLSEETRLSGNVPYSRWKPWSDVEVRTWLFPGLPWHVRVHRVRTARPLTAAEGGFALPAAADLRTERSEGAPCAADLRAAKIEGGPFAADLQAAKSREAPCAPASSASATSTASGPIAPPVAIALPLSIALPASPVSAASLASIVSSASSVAANSTVSAAVRGAAASSAAAAATPELSAFARCSFGASGIRGLRGYGRAELVFPQANTNVLHPRTVIPTLLADLDPGVHWLVCAVMGEPNGSGEGRANGSPAGADG